MELTSVLSKYTVAALSAALLSFGAVAQPAVADDLDDALDLMEDTLDAMDDFNDILNTCTDRESADLAAPQLIKTAAELRDCMRRADRLDSELTDEEKTQFLAQKPKYEKEINAEKAELNAHINNLIENNAFGSEDLVSAMQTVSELLAD